MSRPKTFCVVLGKDDASLEKGKHEELKRQRREGLFKTPVVKRFLGEPGVWIKSKGIVLDIDEAKLPLPLRLVAAEAVLSASPVQIHRINAERIAVMKQIASMGYRIVSPVYPQFHSPALVDRLRGLARVFKGRLAVRDRMVIRGRETLEIHPSLLWARDLWKKVGNRRITFFSAGGEDPLGDGGRTVPLSSNSTLASSNLEEHPEVQRMKSEGHGFYFAEKGEAFNKHMTDYLGKKVYRLHEHVDLFAGAAGAVLLTDPDFYQTNKKTLKKAAAENGLKIVFVPKKEADLHPANFLELEPNKVLVDRDAKETIKVLRENGVEVVPTAVSIRANRSSGGGVRCFVNEL